MRISDWSSDVCSSDLELVHSRTTPPDRPRALRRPARHHHRRRLRPRAGPAPELHRPRPGRLRPRPRLRRRTLRLGPRRPPPPHRPPRRAVLQPVRSEEHTSELQSLMRISYAVFCLKKKKYTRTTRYNITVHTTLQTTPNQK